MAQCFDKRNRLRRDGTSQRQRRLPALDPTSVLLDEREVEDFLAFAVEFSGRMVHVDGEGRRGNWEAFFACDASAVIAAIENHNPQPVRDAVRAALGGPAAPESLARLFDLIGGLARQLNDWLLSVGTETDYREQIRKRISANLAVPVCRLVGSNLAAVESFPATVCKLDFGGFDPAWGLGSCQPTVDDTLFGGEHATDQRIDAARTRLEAVFTPIYNVFLEVIGLAPRYFDQDLSGRRDHEPHFALFVAFLRLYLVVRDDANKLTERHLDFYYEQVLGIEKRKAQPDHLHLLVELSRQVTDQHRLAEGTLIDAGKDATGVSLRYVVDDDLIANKASISSFKTVFVYSSPVEGFPKRRIIANVTAAPIANSQDGSGGEFEDSERLSWKTLGSAAMPGATLGFALTSRALLLAEGLRVITLSLDVDGVPDELTTDSLRTAFEVRVSGEKGWITPDGFKVEITDRASRTVDEVVILSARLVLTVTLQKTSDAVTFADAEVLGQDFGTTLPILQVTLYHPTDSEPKAFAYQLLKDLRLDKVTLATKVTGMTSVIVQNDDFAMDPGKPFLPFGPTPRIGSSFYVGSQEAFQKSLTSLTLNASWDALPNESFAAYYAGYSAEDGEPGLSSFKVQTHLLQDGEWSSSPIDQKPLFADVGEGKPAGEQEFEYENLNGQKPRIIDELTQWTPSTLHGFLRLTLTGQDFLHAEQVAVVTRQALAMGRMPDCTPGARYRVVEEGADKGHIVGCDYPHFPAAVEAILPNAPYTPTIKAFSLDYTASTDTASAPEALTLFHIEPFGIRRLALPAGERRPYFLPRQDHEGTLYLGIADLQPLQSLSILFQLAEATADADVRKPTLQWAYLADDQWQGFEEHEITADSTRGLITSGIVTFAIPRGITADNARMPRGLHWLSARVEADSGGISELIDAHTQAVRATFVDQRNDADNASDKVPHNDPAHFDAPLEAGTAAGLVRDDAGVAGIEQPYDGFGGRASETGLAFYTRVAERLRHKGRAITLFDYERLVLENFPNLYKVKCINHTDDKHALSPGHLLIAVIPDFTQIKLVNRCRPKVTLEQLDAIAGFLQALNCPFAGNNRRDGRPRLHVLNPEYETVQVTFKVRFHADISAPAFYLRELGQGINRFLSPWAYQDGAEISFGGKVYKSSIINFVEQQPYVDYVTDFVMKHAGVSQDLDAIEAGTPRSILVPAQDHCIKLLDMPKIQGINEPPPEPPCPLTQPRPGEDAIGHLTLNHDFEVSPTRDVP